MNTIDKSEFAEWKVKDNYYYSQTKKLVDLYNKKDFQTIIVNAKELLKKYEKRMAMSPWFTVRADLLNYLFLVNRPTRF